MDQVTGAEFSALDLKKVLVGANYVDDKSFELAVAKTDSTKEIIDFLISNDSLSKDLWGQALAESYGVAYADLNSHPATLEVVKRIPKNLAKEFRVVIFDENSTDIVLATDLIIKNQQRIKEIQKLFPGKNIAFAFSLSEDINKALFLYRPSLEERVRQAVQGGENTIPSVLREVLVEAKIQNASDIHFEPEARSQHVKVRLRIDGVLIKMAIIDKGLYENLLNHLKVTSNLRIDEHQRIQDGAMRVLVDEESLDIRISVAPTVGGEKVSLRILSEYIDNLSLETLGLDREQVDILKKAAKKPHGMIVISGPTGSGKTTTAYTALNYASSDAVNITTIEDPVEYLMSDINQIQVQKDTGISFANGLRSIVRQDPDIIFVGEIRDRETAEIAVNAALTGHLLFSTFHATSASATMPRLLEMDVEPFLLASTMSVVVAQRLVRKLCESCRYSVDLGKEDLAIYLSKPEVYFPKKVTLYRSHGCRACNDTGYKGRAILIEILEVTNEIRELITNKASAKEIEGLARVGGMKIMFEHGIQKVLSGETSLEELIRVVEEPGK